MNNNFYFSNDLFDTAPIGIIALNQSMSVVASNEYAVSELKIKLEQDFVHKISAEHQRQFFQALSKPESRFQFPLQGDTGTTLVEVSILPELGNGDRILYLRPYFPKSTGEFPVKNSEAISNDFIHKISNALTAVNGYVNLMDMVLEERNTSAEEQMVALKRYLREVEGSLQRTGTVIKNQRQYKSSMDAYAESMVREDCGESSSEQVQQKGETQKHIVVVDDEPLVANFLRDLMHRKSYKVTSFTESKKALEFYREKMSSIDLVIMDQNMPDLDGIALATEMLAMDIDLPIILCTGDEKIIAEQESGRVQIKHFVQKPIDTHKLVGMVNTIIN